MSIASADGAVAATSTYREMRTKSASGRVSVLIAGCGDLGTAAGLRFAALGHPVTGWRRNPTVLPPQIRGVAVDLARPPLTAVDPATDVLVIALAADASNEDAYRRAYLEGMSNTLDALDRDGIRPARALFVSSTAVYGATEGDVDETTVPAPDAFNGEVMLRAEEEFLTRLPFGAVLRLGGIYGPGRTRLIDQVRTGEVRTSSRRTARIHRDDAAAAIVHLTTSAAAPGIYLGVDDEAATHADVVQFLARELGVPAPPEGDRTGNRGADRALSNAKLRRAGWRPLYPTYVEGYRAVLRGEGLRYP